MTSYRRPCTSKTSWFSPFFLTIALSCFWLFKDLISSTGTHSYRKQERNKSSLWGLSPNVTGRIEPAFSFLWTSACVSLASPTYPFFYQQSIILTFFLDFCLRIKKYKLSLLRHLPKSGKYICLQFRTIIVLPSFILAISLAQASVPASIKGK